MIVPKALPTGTLTEFLSWNQASQGDSLTASAGNTFIAYVLRPTGTPNQYTVVYSSETLTVPPLSDPAVSERIAYPVGMVEVQAGDVIAFYGAGIPYDTDGGADIVASPVSTPGVDSGGSPASDSQSEGVGAALLQGATITVGDPATFPLVPEGAHLLVCGERH